MSMLMALKRLRGVGKVSFRLKRCLGMVYCEHCLTDDSAFVVQIRE